MTKEELEKEAEEKCVCTDEYMAKMFEIGYLAGAEPREKRIAELEQENKVLTQNLEDTEIVSKALGKENAVLKEQVNILDNCDRLGDVITEAYKEQLTKAKEIIKNLMVYVPVDLKEYEEAKQFINSEVEK